jgi:hypothetical protein
MNVNQVYAEQGNDCWVPTIKMYTDNVRNEGGSKSIHDLAVNTRLQRQMGRQ